MKVVFGVDTVTRQIVAQVDNELMTGVTDVHISTYGDEMYLSFGQEFKDGDVVKRMSYSYSPSPDGAEASLTKVDETELHSGIAKLVRRKPE